MIDNIKADALSNGVPIIKDDGLKYLLDIIKTNKYTEILELGTAVGYSAMQVSKLDSNIHVDTIEKNEEMYKQAVKNIADCGLENQIDVYYMPIEDFKTEKMYDLVFVDAAKAQYGKYLEMFIDNLKPEGKMVFDNMVFHGLIYDVDNIESKNLRNMVKKIIKFRENVHKDERFDIIVKDDIGDGIFVLSRRGK